MPIDSIPTLAELAEALLEQQQESGEYPGADWILALLAANGWPATEAMVERLVGLAGIRPPPADSPSETPSETPTDAGAAAVAARYSDERPARRAVYAYLGVKRLNTPRWTAIWNASRGICGASETQIYVPPLRTEALNLEPCPALLLRTEAPGLVPCPTSLGGVVALELVTSSAVLAAIDELVATGLWGATRSAVAEEIVRHAIRQLDS